MSLSNNIFAWRRDTTILSTFAQSTRRVSGNIDDINERLHLNEEEGGERGAGGQGARGEDTQGRGFQLHFKNGKALWNNF